MVEQELDHLARNDLSGLLTHRFALDEVDAALATLEGSKDCGKVLVTIDPSQF